MDCGSSNGLARHMLHLNGRSLVVAILQMLSNLTELLKTPRASRGQLAELPRQAGRLAAMPV